MSRPPLKLIVQNIVTNANTGASINIDLVVEAIHGRLNGKVFPALASMCRESNATNSCFASGNVVISGSRNELQALLSVHLLIERISLDFDRTDLYLMNFNLDNIVCSCDLGFKLNVDAFVQANKLYCEYEPELFPGAHYRPTDPEMRFVLFKSGRVAVVGLKTYDLIAVAKKKLEVNLFLEK